MEWLIDGARDVEQNKTKYAQRLNKARAQDIDSEVGGLLNNPKGFAVHFRSNSSSLIRG